MGYKNTNDRASVADAFENLSMEEAAFPINDHTDAWIVHPGRHRSSALKEDKVHNKDKLHTGDLYLPTDENIMKEQRECLDKLYDFNMTRPNELDRRKQLLKEMFAEIGDGCYIEPPLYTNFGGRHVHFGKHVYANFHLTLVDDTHIYVGDYTKFGPNVTLATAGHPVHPELRKRGYQYNCPIHIGSNCWIGAGVSIMPGITVGDNAVIGAGSIVTKDIPSDVVAVGNPCKPLRAINERDCEYYFKDRRVDKSLRSTT